MQISVNDNDFFDNLFCANAKLAVILKSSYLLDTYFHLWEMSPLWIREKIPLLMFTFLMVVALSPYLGSLLPSTDASLFKAYAKSSAFVSTWL